MSLGVQSLDDSMLELLGRRHTAADAREAVAAIRRGGIRNLSLDLMYGLPSMSQDLWERTLDEALALQPEHLSCYLLTVDDRVPMGRAVSAGRLLLPEDEQVEAMYRFTQRRLADAGFEHYEISNWARPGRQSRHNLSYWLDEPYLGFGAGAASSWYGRRWKNHPDPATYIESVAHSRAARIEDEVTRDETRLADFVGLRLRLRAGLDPAALRERFGLTPEQAFGDELEALRDPGVLEWHDGRLRVTEGAMLLTNEIIARLLGAMAAPLAAR